MNNNQQRGRHGQTKPRTTDGEIPQAQPESEQLDQSHIRQKHKEEENPSTGQTLAAIQQPPVPRNHGEQRPQPTPQRMCTPEHREAERPTNLQRPPANGRKRTAEAAARGKTGCTNGGSSREQRRIGRDRPFRREKAKKERGRSERRPPKRPKKPTTCPQNRPKRATYRQDACKPNRQSSRPLTSRPRMSERRAMKASER